MGWVFRKGLPQSTVRARAERPDRPGASGRRSALPECGARDQYFIRMQRRWAEFRGGVERPWLRVCDAQAGGEELFADDIPTLPVDDEAEVFNPWVCEVDCVHDVPDLSEGRHSG